MPYSVKEIYYTLQGEGAQSGRAAVFLRFAGCNLWSGRESDRDRGLGGCSRWCDTDFLGTDGPGGGRFLGAEQLANSIQSAWAADGDGQPFVVCTGGEPLLQLDEDLIREFHRLGFEVAVETNGTLPLPSGIDWVCVSPKPGPPLAVLTGDELKLVYPQRELDPRQFSELDFRHFFLQPMDGPDAANNIPLTVQYCLAHPRWRLSLQTHKSLGIR